MLTDRERIAHDLHDHVIQRLFAAGMDLQGSIARARSPELVERLSRTVDDLHATIQEIRTTIFGLQHPSGHVADFRQRIQRLIADLTDDRGISTTLQMVGPMTVMGVQLADHAEAVITEAISNTVRHSGASRLTIEITAVDELAIDIIDDGRGIPPTTNAAAAWPTWRTRRTTRRHLPDHLTRPRAAPTCTGLPP